jgi:hypothetical protein
MVENTIATVAIPEVVEDPLPLTAVIVVVPPGGGVSGAK